jgi:predicted  nucleic acid-binding Zn-ribbon protein
VEINFELLINLQGLDEKIEDISQFLDSIPSQIQAIDKKISDSAQIVAKAKDKLTQNQKKRRDLESDVQDQKILIARYRKQLNDVKTNKGYTSLLKEIEDVETEIEDLEEEIISEMLTADDLEAEIKTTEKKAAEIRDTFLKEKDLVLKKEKEQGQEKEQLTSERESLIPTIPSDQMGLYKSIFRQANGTALSPVTDDFCFMCQIRIRPQVLNELIARKEIILCENCGRILYWQPKK